MTATGPKELTVVDHEALATSPRAMLGTIMQAVTDKSIDPARVREFLDIAVILEKRNAEVEYTAAMNRLQPKLPRITKKGRIQLTKNGMAVGAPVRYAKWDDIHKVCMPLLNEEGFSVSFNTEQVGQNCVKVICTISHRAGHSKDSSVVLPALDESPGKGNVQKAGSVFSYGKRYSFCDALNILTEDQDDDGTGQGVKEPITLEQKNQILGALQVLGAVEERRLLSWLDEQGINSIEEIPQGAIFDQVIKALRKKMTQKGQ